MKSIIFVSLLVAAIAIPLAEAQTAILGLGVNITGIVSCSANASVPGTPPFPNATVALQCGGTVIANATTNANGAFSIGLSGGGIVTQNLVNSLLTPGACKVVVITPLANCNVTLGTLPSTLTSALQLTGITVQGLLAVILNFTANLFKLI